MIMNTESKKYKIIIVTRSADCGYKLNHANRFFMNVTRLEAIKAEFHQLQLQCEIDDSNAVIIQLWINKLEKRYLRWGR